MPIFLARMILGTVFVVSLWNVALADQITFQGLSGSSTRRDVQTHFPNSHLARRITCRAGEKEEVVGPERQILDCDQLELDGYEVAGTRFDVSFDFGGQSHNLLYVNLIYW